MSSEFESARQLAEVLRETGSKPHVNQERIVRSTLYDLDYHVALIACAFFIIPDDQSASLRRIVAHWLKILQFVAVRPDLLSDFIAWARTRRHQELDTWQKMPRGYVGDITHDSTVDLLLAGGMLQRDKDVLVVGPRFAELQRIYDDVVRKNLLLAERETLHELSKVRVNKTLIEGK